MQILYSSNVIYKVWQFSKYNGSWWSKTSLMMKRMIWFDQANLGYQTQLVQCVTNKEFFSFRIMSTTAISCLKEREKEMNNMKGLIWWPPKTIASFGDYLILRRSVESCGKLLPARLPVFCKTTIKEVDENPFTVDLHSAPIAPSSSVEVINGNAFSGFTNVYNLCAFICIFILQCIFFLNSNHLLRILAWKKKYRNSDMSNRKWLTPITLRGEYQYEQHPPSTPWKEIIRQCLKLGSGVWGFFPNAQNWWPIPPPWIASPSVLFLLKEWTNRE